MYTAKIRQVAAQDGPGGRTVIVDCDVTVGRTLIAQCQQQFLVREATGGIGESFQVQPTVLTQPEERGYDTSRALFEHTIVAPSDLNAFAHISGDLNPIHRDPAVALIAGLQSPIVHGQWTAATACGLLVGEERRLLNSRAEFLGPVLPGESLTFKGEVTGLSEGNEVCLVTVSNENGPVLRLTATRECRSCTHFPGQGLSERAWEWRCMLRLRCQEVWDRADGHTRETYGFSILQIVRENPNISESGRVTSIQKELNVTHSRGALFSL